MEQIWLLLPEEVEPHSANNRMQLTQLVYDREVIWNRSHPDHSVLAKRYEAFDEVARELGMSMPELKHHWRTLGGKVVTKITNTIAAIISTRQRLKGWSVARIKSKICRPRSCRKITSRMLRPAV